MVFATSEPRNRRRCHEFNPTRGGCLAGHPQHLGGTAGGRDDLRGEDGGIFFSGKPMGKYGKIWNTFMEHI